MSDPNAWLFKFIEDKFQLYLSGFHTSGFSTNLTPYIFSLLGLFVTLYLLRKALNFRSSIKEDSVLLELTPPAVSIKTAYTTSQLFSVIHELGKQKTFRDKLLGRKTRFSFEIASTHNQGIRYFIRTTQKEINNVKRYLISYLPQINVKVATEYLPTESKFFNSYQPKVIEFKLSKHFAYPLQRQEFLKEHDPVAYITGMMTKLSAIELISFQMVLSPTKSKETITIQRKTLNNEDVLTYLNKTNLPTYIKVVSSVLILVIKLIASVLGALAETITGIFINEKTKPYREPHQRPKRTLNHFEQEAVESIQQKIAQPLFESSIRLLVFVKNKEDQTERIRGFTSSLATFSVSGYQALVKRYGLPDSIWGKVKLFTFKKRLLSLINNDSSSLLSVSEASDLYHFPYLRVNQTENIIKLHSKELPAPISLKQENKLDVVFGKNTYGGEITDIGLTKEEREKHMYIIGATGAGKSTMITAMAENDIKQGRGICVIDPHGDLAQSLIGSVPDKRKKDFIYINPYDIKFPVGLNLLELTPNLDPDELLQEKELITESVVSLFRKIFSEALSGHGHRLEYILRNTIQTALTMEDPTIFTVYELLTDPNVQRQVFAKLADENLKNFWKYEFGKAGDYQKVKMIGPVTSRIGRFLFSPSAKRMLEQKHSTIDFDDILDNGKILICNLAKGNIGEDNTEVMGIMILTKIQLAALRRARTEQKNRTPFYLYVDEFQTFATPSFVQMLSEARKYKIFLTIAEQSTSQQNDRSLVNVILANVGTVVSFKSSNPEDEKVILPQFTPYIDQGEIANLPKYKFYMKISADDPQEPFSGETILTDIKEDKKKVEGLIQSSRDHYAITYKAPVITTNAENKIAETSKTHTKNDDEFGEIGTLS